MRISLKIQYQDVVVITCLFLFGLDTLCSLHALLFVCMVVDGVYVKICHLF